jgi:RNA polymerase sigma-70 factor (ECF subfamily)
LERNEEIEIARRLMAGEPEAFDRFVGSFRSRIFQYSMLTCGQREDAEEVAQDTLLKVFESFGQLRDPEHVRSWVFRIARNACLMKRRKSVFAPAQEVSLDERLTAPEGGELAFQIAGGSEPPDARVLRGELREALQQAISGLPEMYRSVLLLRDIEELSTGETAQVLELSADVVKTRLHRARVALREKLNLYLQAASVVPQA